MSQNLVSTPNLPENKRGGKKTYPHSQSFFGFGKPKPMRLFRKPSFCDISGSIHVSNRIVGVHRPLDGVESWKIHSGRGCSHFRKGWKPLATQNAWPKIDAWNTRYIFFFSNSCFLCLKVELWRYILLESNWVQIDSFGDWFWFGTQLCAKVRQIDSSTMKPSSLQKNRILSMHWWFAI